MSFKDWAPVALSLLLLALLGPLSFRVISGIPVTLQTFFVLLPAMLWGWKTGVITVMIYLVAGASGLPVFAGYSSGYEKLLGVSGGYLLSFIPATALAGYLMEKRDRSFAEHFLVWAGGHLLILLIGLSWQLLYTHDSITSQLPLAGKLLTGAVLKSLAGACVSFWFQRKRN